MSLSDSEINEGLRLCEKATPGPWYRYAYGEKCYAANVVTVASLKEGDPMPKGPSVGLEEYNETKQRHDEKFLIIDDICHSESPSEHADLCFIASARTLLPAALSELKELRLSLIGRDEHDGSLLCPRCGCFVRTEAALRRKEKP